MLENDPEIRDANLRRKASWLEKMRWSRWYKGGTMVVKIAIPTAIAIATLTACTPKVDEQQQKAYKNYLSAWGEYQTAVSTYDKLETPDKLSLPSKLVIANDLDEKATTEALNSKTTTLQNATTEINELCEALKNNDTQKVAYQSYLSAWETYANAVAEYEALENAEKPALPANLVISKVLTEKSTTKELNDESEKIKNATAEINKLIKQYEQETPTPPNPPIDYDKLTPADLTEEQKNTIVTKVTTALKANIDKTFSSIEYDVVAMEFYVNESSQGVARILFNYTTSLGEFYEMRDYPMNCELNYKNLLTSELAAADKYAGDKVFQVNMVNSDSRAEEALKKLKDDNQVTYSDLTNVTTISIGSSGIDPTLGCGATYLNINRVDRNKIISIRLRVKSDGNTKDMISENLINGTLGKTYRVVEKFEYEFGENVILLGEMFKEDDSNEVLDVFEHEGQTYAIIRNRYTELKKGAESENY